MPRFELMVIAGDALKTNITTLGPLVLPMSEQLLFFTNLVGRKLLQMKIKPYIPDFKVVFENFCIHARGRVVLDKLEKNLQLSKWHMEPSRMTQSIGLGIYPVAHCGTSLLIARRREGLDRETGLGKLPLGPDSNATLMFGGL